MSAARRLGPMETFSRHSCSKFTLEISHWLPSASGQRLSGPKTLTRSIRSCSGTSPGTTFSVGPVSDPPPSQAKSADIFKTVEIGVPPEEVAGVINDYQSAASTRPTLKDGRVPVPIVGRERRGPRKRKSGRRYGRSLI